MVSELPSHVRIGPYDFKVNPDGSYSDREYIGLCNLDKLTIQVDTSKAPMRVADTFLHEILHAVWFSTNLREVPQLDEELAVSAIATGLLQVLRDNPEVTGWFQDRFTECRKDFLHEALKIGSSK